MPSLQWLILFHDVDSGLARVQAYVSESPRRPEWEEAQIWDFLASRALELHRWPEAAIAATHLAAFAPLRRTRLLLGIAETDAGHYDRAGAAYQQVIQADSADALAWLGLAGLALRQNDSLGVKASLSHIRTKRMSQGEVATIRRYLATFPEVWPSDSLPFRSP